MQPLQWLLYDLCLISEGSTASSFYVGNIRRLICSVKTKQPLLIKSFCKFCSKLSKAIQITRTVCWLNTIRTDSAYLLLELWFWCELKHITHCSVSHRLCGAFQERYFGFRCEIKMQKKSMSKLCYARGAHAHLLLFSGYEPTTGKTEIWNRVAVRSEHISIPVKFPAEIPVPIKNELRKLIENLPQ